LTGVSEVLTAAIIDTILPPCLEYLYSSANFHLVRMDESKLYELGAFYQRSSHFKSVTVLSLLKLQQNPTTFKLISVVSAIFCSTANISFEEN
jgi:hypothetical protein